MKPKYVAKRSRHDAGKPRTFHGKKVVDATKPLDVVVIDKDRKGGIILDIEECAVAKAIKRTYHPISVHVGRNRVLVEHKDLVERYHTPAPIRDQLLRYDASNDHKHFSTGAYKLLPVPPSVIKNRGKRHAEPDRARGNPDNKRPAAVIPGEKGRVGIKYTD